MELTPFSQAIERSSAGFDTAVNSFFGTIRSLAQIKTQQVLSEREAAQQQNFFQFQQDVIQQDRLELEDRRFQHDLALRGIDEATQAQQAQIKILDDSRDDAQKRIDGYMKAMYSDQNRNLSRYNLWNPQFTVQPEIDAAGNLVGYSPVISLGSGDDAIAISEPQFYDMMTRRSQFADFIENVETGKENLGETIQDGPLGIKIGADSADEFIAKIKKNAKYREDAFETFSLYGETAIINRTDGSATGESAGRTPMNDVIPTVGTIIENIQTQGLVGPDGRRLPVIQYGISEDRIFGGDRNEVITVDLRKPVNQVRSSIDQAFAGQILEEEGFTLASLPRDVRRAIITGDSDVYENIPEAKEIRKWIDSEGDRQGGQAVIDLLKSYDLYYDVFKQWSRTSKKPVSANDYFLDIYNIPADLSNMQDFKDVFQTYDASSEQKELIDLGKDLKVDANDKELSPFIKAFFPRYKL